eukprot:CAMPEP_0195040414 /NCGR_PEP_ID=MMETSP0326_2-20130528/80319_1 /TAXON_ID=2866 ORGANISM="Crypthecodinium cohnii, Strain Seligo" /NCGR_SAMPLE_ID=MMETSP0326_2 /ASSEMBLY_ACC=CAM_ASM_000348 /LENGTH=721 /DNA_ID=CAMNT_0040067325 /DNA_START=1048 /DNA_END=3214 /DNA_ORIENTATION=+
MAAGMKKSDLLRATGNAMTAPVVAAVVQRCFEGNFVTLKMSWWGSNNWKNEGWQWDGGDHENNWQSPAGQQGKRALQRRTTEEGKLYECYTYVGGEEKSSLPHTEKIKLLAHIMGGRVSNARCASYSSLACDAILFLLTRLSPKTRIHTVSIKPMALREDLAREFASRHRGEAAQQAIIDKLLGITDEGQLFQLAVSQGFMPFDERMVGTGASSSAQPGFFGSTPFQHGGPRPFMLATPSLHGPPCPQQQGAVAPAPPPVQQGHGPTISHNDELDAEIEREEKRQRLMELRYQNAKRMSEIMQLESGKNKQVVDGTPPSSSAMSRVASRERLLAASGGKHDRTDESPKSVEPKVLNYQGRGSGSSVAGVAALPASGPLQGSSGGGVVANPSASGTPKESGSSVAGVAAPLLASGTWQGSSGFGGGIVANPSASGALKGFPSIGGDVVAAPSGTIQGSSGIGGVVAAPASGTIQGSSGIGGIVVAAPASGTIQGSSGIGGIVVAAPASGTIQGSSGIGGAVVATIASGTTQGSSGTCAGEVVAAPASGTSQGAFGSSGTESVAAPASGTSQGSFGTCAGEVVAAPASGTLQGSSTITVGSTIVAAPASGIQGSSGIGGDVVAAPPSGAVEGFSGSSSGDDMAAPASDTIQGSPTITIGSTVVAAPASGTIQGSSGIGGQGSSGVPHDHDGSTVVAAPASGAIQGSSGSSGGDDVAAPASGTI